MRLTFPGLILIIIVCTSGCKKSLTGDESDLHGTWVKGTNYGDTLWFMKKNGKHILRMADTFNPVRPVYSENEYQFNNEKLSIKLFAPQSQEYFPITSFTWTDPGKEFSILNNQLYLFLSSMITYKYRKI